MMRIGSVPYLNAKPLVWGLDRVKGVELVYEVPPKLADMLKAGELAAGMVSVAACFMNPDLQIAPGMSISCEGPAESVKIFYKGNLKSMRKVALDTSSLTSVLLAKVILGERYGITPLFVDMPPFLDEMLAECDGAVTIGDTTMRAPAGRWHELDLGQEWYGLTGLPFVFAVWALNPTLADSNLNRILVESKRIGLQSLNEISRLEAERLGLPEKVCYHYLSEIMDYDLTDRHIHAIRLLREKALQNGFIADAHEPIMYQPS